MGKGSGTTRGDVRRNARRERLRGLLPVDGAVIGLGEDRQALAVTDHDGRVLAADGAGEGVPAGPALGWAVAQAGRRGSPR